MELMITIEWYDYNNEKMKLLKESDTV